MTLSGDGTRPAGAALNNGRMNIWIFLVLGIAGSILLASLPAQAGGGLAGSLQVGSNVSPALACIDGTLCHPADANGSVTFSGIELSRYHTLVVTADGYQPHAQKFFMEPEDTKKIAIATLRPDNQVKGILQVWVSPYGGTICLDGTDCESYGPADRTTTSARQFGGLAGDQYHTLTVTIPGYRPFTQKIFVNPMMITQTEITMQPA